MSTTTKRSYSPPATLPPAQPANPYFPTVNPMDYVRPIGQPSVIINGAMDIWQRGTSFAGLGSAASQVGPDRFRFTMATTAGTPAVVTYSQSTDVPSPQQAGVLLNYSAQVKFTTGASALTVNTDYSRIYYAVEGYDARQLFGAPFTLSFWVKASVAGTYCMDFTNANNTPSYIAEYQIVNANSWEKKTITVPCPQPGSTWLFTNIIGLYFSWFIGANFTVAGGNATNSPNVWQSANLVGTPNQSNTLMTTTGATFQLAGVKLEPGVISTPFQVVNYVEELVKCQRYCWTIPFSSGGSNALLGMGATTATTSAQGLIPFPVTMRATPTLSFGGNSTHFGFTTSFNAGPNTAASLNAALQSNNAAFIGMTFAAATFPGINIPGWFEWQAGSTSSDVVIFDCEL